MNTEKFTVLVSFSGVAHVYLGGKIYCSVHHTAAGGIGHAKERAETIAKLLNEANA